MQDEIKKGRQKVKKVKDGKYIDRCGVKIWSDMDDWLDVAQNIR